MKKNENFADGHGKLNPLVRFWILALIQWVFALIPIIGILVELIVWPFNWVNQWARTERKKLKPIIGYKGRW